MFKRLEQEAIRADLMSVNTILAGRTPDDDPVGWFQFSRRRAELEQQLADLDAKEAARPCGRI